MHKDSAHSTGRSASKKGFAAMDPEKQKAIARLGGQTSHGGGAKYHKRKTKTK